MPSDLAELLTQTASAPSRGLDLEAVKAQIDRRRHVRRAAGVVGSLAVVVVAVVAVTQLASVQQVDFGPGDGGRASPVEEADHLTVSLELDHHTVVRGEQITARYTNHTQDPWRYGAPWILHRHGPDGWEAVGALPAGHEWPMAELVLEPGVTGQDIIVTSHLDPGLYRYTREFEEGAIAISLEFTVLRGPDDDHGSGECPVRSTAAVRGATGWFPTAEDAARSVADSLAPNGSLRTLERSHDTVLFGWVTDDQLSHLVDTYRDSAGWAVGSYEECAPVE